MLPFLKWPGGKRWLVQNHPLIFPDIEGTYFEPFLGGAAVFFLTNPDKAVLSDSNTELINVYKQVRKFPTRFSAALLSHHHKHSKDYYYAERDRNHDDNFDRAVQFVYLNRTCFNGIYRVNLNGKFNVPMGTKTAVVQPSDDFLLTARRLRGKDLQVRDFKETIALASDGDLVYADPPYTVKHNLNGFVKYNDKLFRWSDQEDLQISLREASKRGAKVIVSNANHESIRELYGSDWMQYEVQRASIISASSKHRGGTTELLISNFDLQIEDASLKNNTRRDPPKESAIHT